MSRDSIELTELGAEVNPTVGGSEMSSSPTLSSMEAATPDKPKLWQKRLVLVMVFGALLVDNILLTSIVPIVPDLLLMEEKMANTAASFKVNSSHSFSENATNNLSSQAEAQPNLDSHHVSIKTGMLFGSKALVQLIVAPFVGNLVEKIGPKIPMVFGSTILLASTLLFAFVSDYWLLLVGRALQGVGSSCNSVAGLSMLATYYTDDNERGGAFGIALGGLALGVLIGPVFGGMMYELAGRSLPFLVLCGMIVVNAIFQILLLKTYKQPVKEKKEFSMMKLLRDPRVLLTCLTLTVGNFGIAMLEPNLPLWMRTTFNSSNFQQGIVFLPSSLAYLTSTNLFGWFGNRFGRRLGAAMGLTLTSLGFVVLPLSQNLWQIMIPMSVIGVGVGMVDGTMMPTMGLLVDQKHDSAYGAVYALADSAFCIGFAFGPMMSGSIYSLIGFQWMMSLLALTTLLMTPLLSLLGNLKSTEIRSGS